MVPVGVLSAGSMHTGAAAALVHMRVAVWLVESGGTQAAEAVLLVHTGASVSARVR